MMTLEISIVLFGAGSVALLSLGGHRLLQFGYQERHVRRHRDAVLYGLPGGLDLIALQMSSGTTVLHALQHIARHFSDQAIAVEFAHIVRQHRAGSTLAEAFDDFEKRNKHPQVTLFTRVILQAHTQGGAVVQLLTDQADSFRAMIAEDVERRAQEIPVKLLLPLVMFILPATMLPVFAVVIGKLWWQ